MTIENTPSNFIRAMIEEDMAQGKNKGRLATRFPPEPNGHLHIGHAKSICLNFGLAAGHHGVCYLRFDDTNPCKEEMEYVKAIKTDVAWLGFNWDQCYYTSDYFEQLYQYAVQLIKNKKAYVCSLNANEIKELRGTLTQAGRDSPFRNRSATENLDLFTRMRAGEFQDGAHVLRAKIDMASPNLNLRDPTLYRIRRAVHHRTGDKWCLYPMYDFAHCLSDYIEGITHSVCTLEFENNRPLYEWVLEQLTSGDRPRQIEFARLNLTHTILSKRKLIELVDNKQVSGWDDPRMPTISGLRRRGYSPQAIRTFCERIGVAKRTSTVEMALLEHTLREDLNQRALRVMGVLQPLRVVIVNYPENLVEEMTAINNPEDASMGTRKIPFARELYIEQDDFMENPSKKFFRLGPGREVRLRYAYLITCVDIIKDDESGEILELHCTYDPDTKGGNAPDGRRVKGTIHWVSAAHAITAQVRLYDHLFKKPHPELAEDDLNPDALITIDDCQLEPCLASARADSFYQFERKGYFCVDAKDSLPAKPVFNRTVTLRDTWKKIMQAGKKRRHNGS